MCARYKIVVLLLVFLAVGCTRETIFPEDRTEEGLPAQLSLSLNNSDLASESRAGLSNAQEKAIQSVCVLVFDKNGTLVSNNYFPTFNPNAPISTQSGVNMTVYVVANLSAINAGTTPSYFLFNNVRTLNDMKNIKVATAGGDVEAAGSILMYGIKTGVTIQPVPTTTNIPVTLSYVASKIRVMVVSDVPAGERVSLVDWRLQNFAKYSFLEAQATDGVNPSNASDYLSSIATFQWNDTLVNINSVQTPAKYALFYLFENRRGGRTTGAPTDVDPKNKTQYAPSRATAILFRGNYTTLTNQKGFMATIFFGANTYNDYNLQRSKDYTYLVTIKGINQIDIDSRIDPNTSGYQVDLIAPTLDCHYDWRPLRIGSFPGTATIEILDANKLPVLPSFWLKVSTLNLMAFVDNGSGTYVRPTYVPATQMKSVINGISFTDASQMTFRNFYLYADEFVSQEGGSRTATVRVTNSQSAVPIDITITQKGYQVMGNVGLRRFDLLGLVLPLADYRLVVENQEEAAMVLTPGAVPGTEKTTTMQWGFSGIQMQPISLSAVLDAYKRNGQSNSYNLVYTATNALRPPYGRSSTGTISEQTHHPIFNSYGARYCFEKNRDLDGNGKIEGAEIKWYLPSLDELMLLYVGEPSLSQLTEEKISDNPYDSSTEANEDENMGLRPSLGRTGVVTKSTPLNIRCVRALDIVSATSPRMTTLTGAIDNSGFKSTSLRSSAVARPVPVHNNGDAINKKIAPSFVVAKTDYNAVSNPLMSWANACGWTNAANTSSGTGVVNTPARGCHAYSEIGYGAGQWRVPTQRELMLIYLTRKELLSSVAGLVDFVSNTGYWSSTANGSTEAFSLDFSSGIMYNRDKASTFRVRCVRDLP